MCDAFPVRRGDRLASLFSAITERPQGRSSLPTPRPAMSLPAINEMDYNAEKRQTEDPKPKEPRSENQGCACQKNDPFCHAEEGRLDPLRECHPQLSSDCTLHMPSGFQNYEYECLVTAQSRTSDITLLFSRLIGCGSAGRDARGVFRFRRGRRISCSILR
jgi:hypothetical protein